MLSSCATTETNEQLKYDEKKGKQPGNGTQEPKKGKQPGNGTQEPKKKTASEWDRRTHEQTASEWDRRTHEQTARDRDPRTRGDEREVQGETRTARSSSNLRTQSGEVLRRCRRARGEKDGPRICSDFFYVSEARVATPTLALSCSRSGRVTATALEQKGLTQHGVKFFAGFIQQTGMRRFVIKSDGEQTMKALKDAAAKAPEGVASIGQESPVGDHQVNGDIESAMKTLEAQMKATRFGLESRLERQLARDNLIRMWHRLLQVTQSRDSAMARRLGNESKAGKGPEIQWSMVSASS